MGMLIQHSSSGNERFDNGPDNDLTLFYFLFAVRIMVKLIYLTCVTIHYRTHLFSC